MGYYDEEAAEQAKAGSDLLPQPGETVIAMIGGIVVLVVRAGGIILLMVGLWTGIKVITEAWHLYRAPDTIERFTVAIERGSSMAALWPQSAGATATGTDSQNSTAGARSTQGEASSGNGFRPAYFLAWIIALLLLLLIGKLAVWAISTGGQLALYGTGTRKQASS